VGKNGVLEHKSGNISETRKDREKLLWGAYRNSPSLFRSVPSPTPYGLPFPNIRGSQPPTKTPIVIISGTGKAMNFKFGQYIQRVHVNKRPLKISEKREGGRNQGLPKFFGYRRQHPHCRLTLPSYIKPPRISAYTLYFQKLESMAYISAADSMGLSSFKFVQWAPNYLSFLQ